MSGRFRMCLTIVLSTPWLTGVAFAGSSAARDQTQRDLDAMTRHDLCARDDAELKRLHRDLSKPSAARVGAKR